MSAIKTLLDELVSHLQGGTFDPINGEQPQVARRTVGGSNRQETLERPIIEVFPFIARSSKFDRVSRQETRTIRIALVHAVASEVDTDRQDEEDAFLKVMEQLVDRVWEFSPTAFGPVLEIQEHDEVDAESLISQSLMVCMIDVAFQRIIDG